MIRSIRLVSQETFLLLRRDKIFVPAVVVSLVVAALANVASDWSVEDFVKILYDVGYFGFHVTGSLVALFWGVKSVNDSRQEGSIEFELAAPLSRTAWLVGKYCGLALSLVTFGALVTALWQVLSYLNGFGLMTKPQLLVFAYMILGWLVSGALAILSASFLRQAIALFVSSTFWLIGLATSLVAHTMAKEAPELTKKVVLGLTRVWDLQMFNLVDHVQRDRWVDLPELGYRGAYGVILILSLMTMACLIFRRRDVVG